MTVKPFDYNLLPKEGLALLTAPEIDGNSQMFLADFRDYQVLIHKPTGHFLGFSSQLGIRLCRGPKQMIDGMWIVQDDLHANQNHQNIQLTPEIMDFISI